MQICSFVSQKDSRGFLNSPLITESAVKVKKQNKKQSLNVAQMANCPSKIHSPPFHYYFWGASVPSHQNTAIRVALAKGT